MGVFGAPLRVEQVLKRLQTRSLRLAAPTEFTEVVGGALMDLRSGWPGTKAFFSLLQVPPLICESVHTARAKGCGGR